MIEDSSFSLDADVTDAMVRGMVRTLEPEWEVDSIERSPYGTDFVATLDVWTPDGGQTVVLKAMTADLVAPEIARSEPRLLELIGRETNVPVPTVFGYYDEHREYPAPFYLMAYIKGENYENRVDRLSPQARETVLREAGRNLADLHSLGPLPGVGRIGVRDGRLAVLDTDEHPRYDDFRNQLLADCEETLDSLTSGGFFPELADDPTRFADLVPELRQYVRETIPELPPPELPTYCHHDYRYGNLLLNPETGATRAVLDWANLSAADPAYNLASAEGLLLDPEVDGDDRTDTLRGIFRSAYAESREGWSFDRAIHGRMYVYRLACRLDAMACLPLWYRDVSPEERDGRAIEHREFVAEYI
jgi:aminoglycoside phosphotransferase (APT) family kinase protein